MKSVATDRYHQRRRPGPLPLPSEARRRKRVAVHFTTAEYTEILRQAGGVSSMVPAYLRNAALNRLPPTVPEINREAWVRLAQMMTVLDRIAHHLDGKDRIEIFHLRDALARFRGTLVGADLKYSSDGDTP